MLRESNWHDACVEQDEGSRYCRKVAAFDRYLQLYGENYLVSESWMLTETCSRSSKIVPGRLVGSFLCLVVALSSWCHVWDRPNISHILCAAMKPCHAQGRLWCARSSPLLILCRRGARCPPAQSHQEGGTVTAAAPKEAWQRWRKLLSSKWF